MSTKAIVFLVLAGITAGAVAIRAAVEDDAPAGKSSPDLLADSGADEAPHAFLPGIDIGGKDTPTAPAPATETPDDGGDSPLADAIPYVTEGGFFAMIGFALGYASRKVVKLMLIALAGFFLVLQGLSYAEIVHVDWDKALQFTNDLVFNLKENETIGEIIKDRIPTAGALVAGYAIGFRRG